MIRCAVERGERVMAVKIALRVAKANDVILKRDVVGAINIGLKHLSLWESSGVGLDWGPWGEGKAGEPTPRHNPASRNTNRCYQISLVGKRLKM